MEPGGPRYGMLHGATAPAGERNGLHGNSWQRIWSWLWIKLRTMLVLLVVVMLMRKAVESGLEFSPDKARPGPLTLALVANWWHLRSNSCSCPHSDQFCGA